MAASPRIPQVSKRLATTGSRLLRATLPLTGTLCAIPVTLRSPSHATASGVDAAWFPWRGTRRANETGREGAGSLTLLARMPPVGTASASPHPSVCQRSRSDASLLSTDRV